MYAFPLYYYLVLDFSFSLKAQMSESCIRVKLEDREFKQNLKLFWILKNGKDKTIFG